MIYWRNIAFVGVATALFVAVSWPGAATSRADEPLFTKKALLENQAVEAYELHYKPGATASFTHTHPARVIYIVQGGILDITPSGGETKRLHLKPGDTVWRQAGSLKIKNVGTTDVRVFEVEIKYLTPDFE